MADSSRPKSRERAKLETRDALVRAGVELYLESAEEPSLDALCAHAGYTRGAFYVHFKDRTEFLLAVVEQVLKQLLDSIIADQVGSSGNARGPVGETIGRFISAALVERGAVRFLAQAAHRHPNIRERYGAVLEGALSRMGSLIEREQAAGVMRSDLPAQDLSLVLVSAAMGIAGLVDSGVPLDLTTMPDTARGLLGLRD